MTQQKQNELSQLLEILNRISELKESSDNSQQKFPSTEQLSSSEILSNPLQVQINQPRGERGIIRGVLTPKSLHKNIVSSALISSSATLTTVFLIPVLLQWSNGEFYAYKKRPKDERPTTLSFNHKHSVLKSQQRFANEQ